MSSDCIRVDQTDFWYLVQFLVFGLIPVISTTSTDGSAESLVTEICFGIKISVCCLASKTRIAMGSNWTKMI